MTPDPDTIFIPGDASRSAYFHQYLSPWALSDEAFRALVETIERTDLREHIAKQNSVPPAAPPVGTFYEYEVTSSGVAVVQVAGVMMKMESSFIDSTSTIMLRRTFRAAAADADVKGVLLVIDSPGGSV